jgi:hypothetical protein
MNHTSVGIYVIICWLGVSLGLACGLVSLFNKPKKKISRVGINDFSLKLGCDCAVVFVIEASIEQIK